MDVAASPWPTFSQVKEHLRKKCQVRYTDLTRPGDPKPVGVLERDDNGKRYSLPVSHRDDEALSDHMIRSICRRLGISPVELGVMPEHDDGAGGPTTFH